MRVWFLDSELSICLHIIYVWIIYNAVVGIDIVWNACIGIKPTGWDKCFYPGVLVDQKNRWMYMVSKPHHAGV